MTRPEYPSAERLDLVEDLHGQPVADPYRWLEDAADPRVVAWQQAQDELFTAVSATWPGQERLRSRLTELVGSGSVSEPVWRGDRAFFTRRTADQDHAVLLTIDPDGGERVLLDPMVLDPAGTTTLNSWSPSSAGDLLAYQIAKGGVDETDLYVLDVATGRIVDGPIDRAEFSPIGWLPDGASFYYNRRLDPELTAESGTMYHHRVWLHRVGADPATDVQVFGEDGSMVSWFVTTVAADDRRVVLGEWRADPARNDLWVADLAASPAEAPVFTPVQVGVKAQTMLRFARPDSALADRGYLLTDRDAPRKRLCVAPIDDLAHENWRDLIPEDPEAVLADYVILDGPELARPLLVASWSRHAVGELTVHDLETGEKIGEVPLPGLGTVSGSFETNLSARPEGGHEVWFSYTDFATPAQIYRYDARTGQVSLWAAAPGDIAVPPVRVRQLSYRSKDGTEVRMFVIDGDVATDTDPSPRPTILYGYGGFNIPLTPEFEASILAWVEAGGRYVIASLRGGAEEGEEWHRAGMMANKQNVFDDFHAAADHLVAEGLTTTAQLGIYGGSNGGLLVGAALTQHPEKYTAVVCTAPVLDMIRYERFGSGQIWNEELGTAADPEQLGWLLAYSPYHNVRAAEAATDYPATLFNIFEGDTRVDPAHARKFAAALQHATGGDRPLLVRNEAGVGHTKRAVSRSVGESVDWLAFFADRLGLDLA